jgi:hypothetical protein
MGMESACAPMASEVQELSHFIRMDRRAAVRYIFCGVYGMPPREEWQLEGGKTLVSEKATRLSISIGNRGLIVDVMLECLKHGAEFEIAARLSLRGRTNLIEELSTQAEVICGAVESGQGIQQATVLLNQYRKALPEPEAAVSWSCVRCFYHVALTSCLQVGDPLKFKMGTPAEVLQTLERCWAIAPSGPPIVEDISALVRVLEKIVANEGACLLDEF